MATEASHNRPRFLDTIKSKVKGSFSRSRSPSTASRPSAAAAAAAASPSGYQPPSPFIPPTPASLPTRTAPESRVARPTHAAVGDSSSPATGLGAGGDELWRHAFERLEAKFPEEWACLHKATYGEQSQHSVEQAIETWRADKSLDEKLHPYQKKTRECLENIVKVTQTFSPLIQSAAAMNPYASMAWSGVSAILPALLVPGSESEAAFSGIEKICQLIQIYMTYETFLASMPSANQGDLAALKSAVEDVYLYILEYEAAFLLSDEKSGLKQAGSSIAHKGQWETRTTKLQSLDQKALRIKESIFEQQQSDWISEQRAWQAARWKESRWQRLKVILDTLHNNNDYLEVKKSKQAKGVRAEGTCQWFLRHPEYQALRQSEGSRLLWVTAGPGCGKSTLAVYLVDTRAEGLLKTLTTSPIFLYYFFSYEFSDRNNATCCVRALIHQLFLAQIDSYSSGDDLIGPEEDIADPLGGRKLDELWKILIEQLQKDAIRHRGVVCVIDALDECEEDSRRPLIRLLDDIFPGTSGTDGDSRIRLKLILTSRPYDIIEDEFRLIASRMENIRLRGEDESETIREEINLVVAARVRQIAFERSLSAGVQKRFQDALNSYENRTYLWLHLITEYFRDAFVRKTNDVEALISEIPPSVEAAYEQILAKSPYPERARQLLCIALATREPLSVAETFTTLGGTRENVRRYTDLHPGIEGNLDNVLTSICGLLLSVVDGKVIFLHQTVREFLMPSNNDDESGNNQQVGPRAGHKWMHSFNKEECAAVLGAAFFRLLLLRGSDDEQDFADDALLGKAERGWSYYLLEGADYVPMKLWPGVLDAIRNEQFNRSGWKLEENFLWASYGFVPPMKKWLVDYAKKHSRPYAVFPLLGYACFNRHRRMVHFLLGHRIEVPKHATVDLLPSHLKFPSELGKCPNVAIVAWAVDGKDGFGILTHPDLQRAYTEHGGALIEKVCQLDFDKNASNIFMLGNASALNLIVWLLKSLPDLRLDESSNDFDGRRKTSVRSYRKRAVLGFALGAINPRFDKRSAQMLDLLLDRGASPDAYSVELLPTGDGRLDETAAPALCRALTRSDGRTFTRLLQHSRLHREYKDTTGRSMLHLAATFGALDSVSALLDTGKYDINERDATGRTCLMSACAGRTWEAIPDIPLLIGKLVKAGADMNLQDRNGDTVLHHTLGRTHWAPGLTRRILEPLLAVAGIQADVRNKTGLSPLDVAKARSAQNDYSDFADDSQEIIELLEGTNS